MRSDTIIVNVKVQYIRPRYANLKEWVEDESNIYIGRGGVVFIDGQRFPKKQSIWANPFKVQNNKNELVLPPYEKYIREKIEKFGVREGGWDRGFTLINFLPRGEENGIKYSVESSKAGFLGIEKPEKSYA